MKSKSVDTVTTNEEHVRLRIFDGDLPLDDAGHELIRIAQAQLDAERSRHNETIAELVRTQRLLREALIA